MKEESSFLDKWGSFLECERHLGEKDEEFRKRLIGPFSAAAQAKEVVMKEEDVISMQIAKSKALHDSLADTIVQEECIKLYGPLPTSVIKQEELSFIPADGEAGICIPLKVFKWFNDLYGCDPEAKIAAILQQYIAEVEEPLSSERLDEISEHCVAENNPLANAFAQSEHNVTSKSHLFDQFDLANNPKLG